MVLDARFLPFRGRALFRGALTVAGLASAPLLSSSCLTPRFEFIVENAGGDDGDGDGDKTTDRTTDGSGGKNSSGDGDNGDGDNGDGDGDVADHCKNDDRDADETDVNCGGMDCDKCRKGSTCEADEDCQNDSCIKDVCRDPSCDDGERNLTESDVDCGGECDECEVGKRCKVGEDCETLVCNDGRCAAATCTDRRKNQGELDVDCGGPCGLCEVGQHCVLNIDCLQPDEIESRAVCNDDEFCELDCNTGTGDCDERAKNGCESNLNSDVENCGECDNECDMPNTQATVCTGGKCEIDFGNGEPDKGCAPGYADCNGDPDDGCEVDLEIDEDNCGECDLACSNNHGSATCDDGQCVIDCDQNFDDCDNDPTTNGCEADLLSSVSHCGGCGASFACDDGSSGQSPACEQGECKYYGCPTNFGACDGDGVCNDSLTSNAHCGQCGNVCLADRGTSSCVNSGGYGCLLTSCQSGYGNCDNNPANGCETNTDTNKTHCGGCNNQGGANCAVLENTVNLRVAQATCSSGGCLITSCDPGYADCDLNPNNGCEVNLTNNATRCGGCLPSDPRSQSGVNCTSAWANADGTCNSFGTCVFADCDNNYEDCNGGLTNGCETDVRNVNNCGGCGIICGGSAKTNVSGTPTCSSQTCSVSCTSGFCPNTADPERKCTVTLGTTSNCASCGNVCTGTNPFCDGGCKQRFPVQVANVWEGQATGEGIVTVNFSLSTGLGTNRAVVVLVASGQEKLTVNYGATAMLEAVSQKAGSQPGFVSIHYLLDAALGSAGAKTVTVSKVPGWGGRVVEVMELRNVAQTAPSHTGRNEFTGNCPANLTTSATVAAQGSLIVGALTVQHSSPATGTHTGFGVEIRELYQSQAVTGLFGYLINANSTTTVGWNNINTCWAMGLATATFNPLITGP